MQLAHLVEASSRVAATRSRLEKRAALAACLREAAPGEVGLVVHFLTGTLRQGRIGLGPAILRDLPSEPRQTPTLSVADVDAIFGRIAVTSGKGSQQARRELLAALYARATPAERDFLTRLLLGELRQGALEGVLTDAIADAASIDAAAVRRASMLAGELAGVAETALSEGGAGLARYRLRPLSPVKPMLAQPASDVEAALAALGEAAVEYKLDGARVQIHKWGGDVRIFSRRLNDVTASLPEIVAIAHDGPAERLIADGEVIALRDDGRPHAFQVTMSRFGRKSDIEAMSTRLPLQVFLFDCLHHDGEDLIDRPLRDRVERLAVATRPGLVVPRLVTGDPAEAAAFFDEALAQGHEGVMLKSVDSLYEAGRRGAEWLKLKLAHTLDLVVLAVEWGSGRRRGRLSNLHLGARDADGGFVMLGKTFKGLTDEMLEWQTRRLLELEVEREGHIVHVKPELVVEVAVNQIQRSPQYPAGMALRFARVKRYREDKSPAEADTLDTVRAIYGA